MIEVNAIELMDLSLNLFPFFCYREVPLHLF